MVYDGKVKDSIKRVIYSKAQPASISYHKSYSWILAAVLGTDDHLWVQVNSSDYFGTELLQYTFGAHTFTTTNFQNLIQVCLLDVAACLPDSKVN